jgi:hypothetical protein
MVMTQSDVRRANVQNNNNQSKKESRKKNDLAVILLSLSDVRLDETRRTSLSDAASLCIAESLLTWCILDYPAQSQVHFARA